jgi:uncharacterized protein (TIGR03437 family)
MLNGNPSRRSTLRALAAAGAAGLFIPAWNQNLEAADAITCVSTTPSVTEGPYWVDSKLFRSDIRTEPTTGVARAGVPLTLTINVQNLSGSTCTPLAGAYVDIWQCDAKGIYSSVERAYNPGGGTGSVSTGGQTFLRGYQITDENGQVKFTSIFPGWYTSRTIHIHVRVRTYNGSTILSNFVSQIFFEDTFSNTILTDSQYSRTTARDTTNSNDTVYTVSTRERMMSTATGSATAGVTASITMGATFQVPAASSPSISSGGVANAVSGAAGAAPGSWISIYGSNLAAAIRAVASSDLSNNVLPTALGGVSVRINNQPAFLQFVSASQINVLTPSDSSRGSVAVTVTNAAGTATATVNLAAVLPGLSTLSNYVRAVRSDGAIINGTGNAETGYTISAAVGQGDVLSLYGTGFGATSSTLADGAVFSGAYATSNPVTVTIGGVAATVLWAGLVGPGLYQINVRVPTALADGDHAVVATVAGAASQTSGALVKVAASAKLAVAAWRGKRNQWLARGPRHYDADILKLVMNSVLSPKPQGETHGCLISLA